MCGFALITIKFSELSEMQPNGKANRYIRATKPSPAARNRT